MDLELKGLRAVVTGGSSGIGAAIVKRLAQEGCRVDFCSRQLAKVTAMEQGCQGLPAPVRGRALDVTDAAALSQWLGEVGDIDILVANVSAISTDWTASISTDMQATVACVEAALPHLKASKQGAITYIGSLGASYGIPGNMAYGAAKAGMLHYMKSLSMALVEQGIRVNTVSPGFTWVDGGWWDQIKSQAPQAYESQLQAQPMKRFASADEIARVVAFISSPAASYVTGANWMVDGGFTPHVQT